MNEVQLFRWRSLTARWVYRLLLAAIFLFIVTPIIVLVVVSVNSEQLMSFPPKALSLRWWQDAFAPKWTSAIVLSLKLGAVAAAASTALGVLGAIGLVRYRFPGRDAINSLIMAPLMLPAIVTSVAMFQFINMVRSANLVGFPSLLLGHVAVTAPYAVRIVSVSLLTIPRDVEKAAMNLRAGPWETFRYITLPLIRNGVFAGLIFTFILSFNNIPVSLFLIQPGTTTAPIKLLQSMEFGMSPVLAAVSLLTVLINLVLITLAERVAKVSQFIHVK